MTQTDPRQAGVPVTPWHVYIVRSMGGALYTGIAKDVAARIEQHEGGARGAKSLRGQGPLRLVYRAEIGALGLALRVEHRVKRLPKKRKERLVEQQPDRTMLIELLKVV
ncbi:MAG: GIY-YIG nuclease family protein [bacterium]|nr:GIY-YIG nuclease family protein [bacterium]